MRPVGRVKCNSCTYIRGRGDPPVWQPLVVEESAAARVEGSTEARADGSNPSPPSGSATGCGLFALVVIALVVWGGAVACERVFGGSEERPRDDSLCEQIIQGAAGEELTDEMIARRFEAWKNAGCDK